MATRTIANAGGNWNAVGTWVEGAVPTVADDVVATATSGNLTINAAAACRSFDMTGYVGAVTHSAAITLSVGTTTAKTGNVAFKLVPGMTYTLSNAKTSAISLVSTSATQQSVTTGGQTIGNFTVNGVGSSYLFTDNFTTSGNWTITTGTIDVTTNNVIVTLTGATVTFTGGSKTYFGVTLAGSGNQTISGANTYTNLTFTGSATIGDQAQFNNNQTITGTWTIGGNTIQGVNRFKVTSNALGSARLINMAGAAIVINGDTNFLDISIGGAPSWTNASSAFVGDAGGNTNPILLNATTATTQTHSGATSNWSDVANWTSRVPLPQDSVAFSGGVGTITLNMEILGKNINFTNFAGTALFNSVAMLVTGGLTYSSGMTVTPSSTIPLTLTGRSGSFSVTTNGKPQSPTTITAPSSTYTFADDWLTNASSSSALVCSSGTLTVTGNITIAGTGSGTRFTLSGTANLNMGNGTWTINCLNGGVNWNITSTGTLTAQGSTIVFGATSGTSSNTFTGGNKTYNNFTVQTGSTGAVVIAGSNSFANFSQTGGGAKTVNFTAATTQTLSGTFFSGSAGNLITCQSTVAASAWTISRSTGIVSSDYLSLQDSTATGGATFYAGANSTNVSGNTGWLFTAPPSSFVPRMALLGVG